MNSYAVDNSFLSTGSLSNRITYLCIGYTNSLTFIFYLAIKLIWASLLIDFNVIQKKFISNYIGSFLDFYPNWFMFSILKSKIMWFICYELTNMKINKGIFYVITLYSQFFFFSNYKNSSNDVESGYIPKSFDTSRLDFEYIFQRLNTSRLDFGYIAYVTIYCINLCIKTIHCVKFYIKRKE